MELTAKLVSQAEPTGKQYFLWDSRCRGFGVRVTPAGAKSYIIQYAREDDSKRRLTIAPVGTVNLHQARAKAQDLLAEARLGEDPAEKKKQARAKAEKDITVKALGEKYMAEYAKAEIGGRARKKPSSVARDQYLIDRFVTQVLGRKRVSEVTRADVIRLHESLAKTPTQANRVMALCSKMFNLAERWELRPDNTNPCRHVERYEEKPRERYLSAEELSRLGAAVKACEDAGDISQAAATLFRLLLLSGMRVGELLTLRWADVDLKAGLITLFDSKTGAKQVPLGDAAVQLLKSAHREVGNPYVIPSRRRNPKGERTHMTNPAKPWGIVRKKAGLEDVRLHDTRHSFASIGVGRGEPGGPL